MTKQNDMVLNILANPEFQVRDFQAVGLKADNTNFRTEEEYLKSEKITKNPLFSDEQGNFDKGKFHEFYIGTGQLYNQLAQQDYRKTILDSAMFSEDNIWVEPNKRKVSYAPKLVRTPNEYLVSSSLDGVGKKGQRTRSEDEIAQTQKVFNVETGKWEASPNDSFFGHFMDTLVLATYDKDEYDENGKLIHQEGEKKLNDDGLPYYETLGGRNPSKKRVLNKLNVLTTDGSFANRFDFFDEDDIKQKSIGGSILRNTALVGSMFIPYVGQYITAASVLTQVAGLGATLGKVLTGSDSPTLNNIQGWAKSVSRSGTATEYASQNTWCVENLLNMIGDTAGQLAEQRWIFKAAPALLQGSIKPYQAMSTKGREKLIKETAKKLEKDGSGASLEKLIEHIRQSGDPSKLGTIKEQYAKVKEINQRLAATEVDNLIKNSTKMGSPLAKAYMTGITVQDTYDEAKNAGASDIEAAMLTIGYAAAEATLLNTELGEWIMPELHGDRFRREAVARALADVKNTYKNNTPTSATSKVGFIQSLIQKGKEWFNHEYSRKLMTGATKGSNVVVAHALGESFEEVSEEVLADFSKSVFNATRWLRGEDSLDMGQWDNMFDRYGMSALGGFFGGGINSVATDFVQAKNLANMTRTQALQEIIYMVNNGEDQDFLKNVDKMTLGDKNLSANRVIETGRNEDGSVNTTYQEASNIEDSQDFQAKRMVYNTVNMVKNILESEGARVSTDSLISTLTAENKDKVMKDLRLGALKDTVSLGLYLQEFQNLQDSIVKTKAEIMALEHSTPDSGEPGDTVKNLMLQKNQELLKLRTKKDQFLNGKASASFISDALFEMNPVLHSFAIKLSQPQFLEELYGKSVDEMSDSEKEEGMKKYEAYAKTSMKNDIHRTNLVFRDMLENSTPLVQSFVQSMQQAQQNDQPMVKANSYVQNILSAMTNLADKPGDTDNILGEASKWLDALNVDTLKEAAQPFIDPAIIQQLSDIHQQIITPIEGESANDTQYRIYALKSKYTNILCEAITDKIDAIMQPIQKQPYLNPELKNSLIQSLEQISQYYNSRFQDAYGIEDPMEMKRVTDDLKQRKQLVDTHIRDLKMKSNTPIIDWLAQYQKNVLNSDVDLMEHWNNTMALFADASKNGETDASELIVSDEWVENNKEVTKILDSFEAILQGMRVDNGDFNNPTGYTKILNTINSKVGNTDWVQLAEIDRTQADLILQDIQTLKNRFNIAENLSAINRGQKLKQQEKVATRTNFLLYKNLSHLSDVVPDDWKGADKLKATISNASFLSSNYLKDSLNFSKEEKKIAQSEMLEIEDAIYDFFNANKDSNSKLDKDKVGKLLQVFAGDDGFFAANDDLLTENSTSIDANSFIWWLASRAALRGTDFYSAYQKSLSDDRAPISSQELATYLGVASIVNMDVLNTFVDAYKDTVVQDFRNKSEDERIALLQKLNSGSIFAKELLEYFGGHDQIPQYHNMIFIEGAPGTGKSKGVFKNIVETVKNIDPTILDKAWYAHATDKSAKEASSFLGLNGETFDRKTLLTKLSNEWVPPVESNIIVNGKTRKGLVLKDGSYKFENGKLTSTFKLNKYSTDELPKLIFIDEVTHYNEQELSLIERFARENGIVVLTAGDLHQDTQVAYVKVPEYKEHIDVSIARNKFIRTPKLGVSLRSRNKAMEDSMDDVLRAFKAIKTGNTEIHTYYTDDDKNKPGLYGVKVIQSDKSDDISDNVLEDVKKTIDMMAKTLKDGQKIGYIRPKGQESKLYEYLTTHYKDLIENKEGISAHGLEGQYYIVENYRGQEGNDEQTYLRSLYTGISRAEQGILVIANNGYNIGNVGSVYSTKAKELQILNLGPQAIKRASDVRKEQLDYMLEDREVRPITITNPTKVDSTVLPPASPTTTPGPLPPPLVIQTPPAIIDGAWTNRDDLVTEIERLRSTLTSDTKVRHLATGDELTFSDYNIKEEDKNGTPVYIPMVNLKDSENNDVNVTLEEFKTNYEFFTPNSVVPIYNIGDKITIDNGSGTANYEISNVDITDPNMPKYTITNLNDGSTKVVTQTELQAVYKGIFVPPITLTSSSITTGLENSGEELKAIITGSNETEEIPQVQNGHINHILYTFNAFNTGMYNDGGKAKFNGPKAKFDARIDNMIGLTKILGTDDYLQLESYLGNIKNIIGTESDNSKIVTQVANLLGITKPLEISYAIKSTAGRTTGTGIYDRFDQGDDESLSYIISDDQDKAKTPMRKNLVAIFNDGENNILEISLGDLNSPITLIQEYDQNGQPVYPEVYSKFWNNINAGKNFYDNLNDITSDVIIQTKYPDLVDLCKLWQYTSNGIFYLDNNFSLASHESSGPQLSKKKGHKQVIPASLRYGTLQFEGDFIDISKFAEHPQHQVSSIMMVHDNTLGGVKIPGLNQGHAFVLVSDTNKYRTDQALVQRYLDQVRDNTLSKDVRLFYVVPPSATVGDWLRNIHNLYTNKLPDGNPYRTTNIVYDIGNDFTAYHILRQLMENGEFDNFTSSQDTADGVKQAIKDMEAIEAKWNAPTLDLDHNKIIEGRAEDDYFNWFKNNGFSEKDARRYMSIREQMQYLNKRNGWGRASLPADRTIAQGFSGYLTNIVWKREPVTGNMITDQAQIDQNIAELEAATKGFDKIYYKSQYSDDTVYGNFVKVKVDATDKYSLGNTPSGITAAYQINAKIDTSSYLLNDISPTIHDIVQHIYYNTSKKIWTSDVDYKKQNEDRYLKKRAPQTIGQLVANKYAEYKRKGLLNTAILADDSYTTEHEMLVALAKSFNQTEGNYGFVYNDRLYLTQPGVRLTNSPVEITSASDSVTIKNAVLNGEPVDIQLDFVVDPTTSTITSVESRYTHFKNIDIQQGSFPQVDDSEIETLRDALEAWRAASPANRRITPTFGPSNNPNAPHIDFTSPQTFRASFIQWANSLSNMKQALTSLRTAMNRGGVASEILEILEKLREFDNNVTNINLEIGDIVRTPDGTQRYQVQDVEAGLVTQEDGAPLHIDFESMQKEEMDCHPTLWNIL